MRSNVYNSMYYGYYLLYIACGVCIIILRWLGKKIQSAYRRAMITRVLMVGKLLDTVRHLMYCHRVLFRVDV